MQCGLLLSFFCVVFLVEMSATYDSQCTPPLFFVCHNRRCISHIFICDNDDDCGDNSDENPEHCHKKLPSLADMCKAHEFQCADRFHCISKDEYCDGKTDCIDGSDEVDGCHQNKPCNSDECTSTSCRSFGVDFAMACKIVVTALINWIAVL